MRPTAAELGAAALAGIPAALVGALAQDAVERRLGRPGPTAALLASAGLALVAADRRPTDRRSSPTDLAVAGAAQVVALAPGVSRAGATITALRLRGVDREDALRTSLVLSLPVTLGAAALTAVRAKEAPPLGPSLLAGAAAFATARRVRGSARFFTGSAAYRLGLAAAVAVRLRKERK